MPTYALLGATGATGSAILRCLLADPPTDLDLNILVRSTSKLLRAFPNIHNTPGVNVHIAQGSSTDTSALQQCLEDADLAFMCVAEHAPHRGVSLTHDTVSAIATTLDMIRKLQGSDYNPPTILQLRSASLNPKLSRQTPHLINEVVSFCLHHTHLDMAKACHIYETAAQDDLLDYIYVDPPTIHDSTGTQRTGHKLISCKPAVCEKQATALSYADLGASFVEIAARREEFANQPVGVTATGKVRENWPVVAEYLWDGAKGRVKGWMGHEKASGKSASLFLYCGL